MLEHDPRVEYAIVLVLSKSATTWSGLGKLIVKMTHVPLSQ